MTRTSNTSKPSTESDTATKNSRWFRVSSAPHLPEFEDILNLYWGGPERRITGLTVRIIGINAAALVMLLIGMIYLGQYQNGLIESRLQTFKTEVELVSAALSEAIYTDANGNNNAPPVLDEALAKKLIVRFSNTIGQHLTLFDSRGKLVADSETLTGRQWDPKNSQRNDDSMSAVRVLKNMAGFVLKIFPGRRELPVYPQHAKSMSAHDYPDAEEALSGPISISVWQDGHENIILSAAAALRQNENVAGIVHLTRGGGDITYDLGEMWLNIVAAFFVTLVLTTLLSVYLSNVIATPLRRLAQAAERVRRGKSKITDIPDFGARKDEIGELSIALRDMTQALWEKMDSIEAFAADVAHELKNPLTSMRSAVETMSVVKKEEDRKKLLAIMQHDVERMDRLITDISSLSRLDSELSREAFEIVDLGDVLGSLVETYKNPQMQKKMAGAAPKEKINFDIRLSFAGQKSMAALGLSARLVQVFDNLIANAISFSPPGGLIDIRADSTRKNIFIAVTDQGPGIPDNKLETIFERFYSERPKHEDYGRHSGLGLSICRQIVTAMGGRIYAENVRSDTGQTVGARFTVILNRANEDRQGIEKLF